MNNMTSPENYQSYSIINNVTESLLELNPLLINHGHELIKISLEEFENSYSELVPHTKSKTNFICYSKNNHVSESFWRAMQLSKVIGFNEQRNGFVILLRNIDIVTPSIEENPVDHLNKAFNDTQNFTFQLIRQLRLFKAGDVSSCISFIKGNQNNILTYKMSGSSASSEMYVLTQSEVKSFAFRINKTKFHDYIEMALNNFELSYSDIYIKLRYIILIQCLELLFNKGGSNISHVISRHLALVVSNSKEDFEVNYCNIKALYQKRNEIVHGGTKSINTEDFYHASRYVRSAILGCIELNKSKEDLFNYLNYKGF